MTQTRTEIDTKLVQPFVHLCNEVDEHIKNQPDLEDLNATHVWITELQSYYATLAQYEATAQRYLSEAMYIAIRDNKIGEDAWKRIGRSSTLTNDYLAGMHGIRYQAWKRLHNLMSVVKSVFDNCRTMIATLRESDKLNRFAASRQNNDESKAGNYNPKRSEPNDPFGRIDQFFPPTER